MLAARTWLGFCLCEGAASRLEAGSRFKQADAVVAGLMLPPTPVWRIVRMAVAYLVAREDSSLACVSASGCVRAESEASHTYTMTSKQRLSLTRIVVGGCRVNASPHLVLTCPRWVCHACANHCRLDFRAPTLLTPGKRAAASAARFTASPEPHTSASSWPGRCLAASAAESVAGATVPSPLCSTYSSVEACDPNCTSVKSYCATC